MEAFQQRVVDELNELQGRRRNLAIFVTSNPTYRELPLREQGLLTAQLRVMLDYESVLERRIALFPKEQVAEEK
jgi:hypothetical protein